MEAILEGISLALTWDAMLMVALGVFAGITVGAIPGLTSVMAIAVLVPFSFFMAPTLGIPFLLGIHKGALFGGSIPAILVNTPGTTPSAATCLDGYPLAQKGESKSAIEMSLISIVTDDEASPEQKVLFKNAARLFGRLANAIRVAAHSPRITQVLYGFIVAVNRKEISGNLDVRPRLLATLKTSMLNGCNY